MKQAYGIILYNNTINNSNTSRRGTISQPRHNQSTHCFFVLFVSSKADCSEKKKQNKKDRVMYTSVHSKQLPPLPGKRQKGNPLILHRVLRRKQTIQTAGRSMTITPSLGWSLAVLVRKKKKKKKPRHTRFRPPSACLALRLQHDAYYYKT